MNTSYIVGLTVLLTVLILGVIAITVFTVNAYHNRVSRAYWANRGLVSKRDFNRDMKSADRETRKEMAERAHIFDEAEDHPYNTAEFDDESLVKHDVKVKR